MTSCRNLIFAALALALLQIGFLGWMIVDRASVLRDGREVLLKVEPVDPRDLLRGDYVILSYGISRIPLSMIADIDELDEELTTRSTIIVRLHKAEDGYWEAGNAWVKAPPASAGAAEVDIKGQIPALNRFHTLGEVRVAYGIERFYLPEGEGRAIERDMGTRPFAVRVAVSEAGKSQVKALLDGDQTLFQEPLY